MPYLGLLNVAGGVWCQLHEGLATPDPRWLGTDQPWPGVVT